MHLVRPWNRPHTASISTPSAAQSVRTSWRICSASALSSSPGTIAAPPSARRDTLPWARMRGVRASTCSGVSSALLRWLHEAGTFSANKMATANLRDLRRHPATAEENEVSVPIGSAARLARLPRTEWPGSAGCRRLGPWLGPGCSAAAAAPPRVLKSSGKYRSTGQPSKFGSSRQSREEDCAPQLARTQPPRAVPFDPKQRQSP